MEKNEKNVILLLIILISGTLINSKIALAGKNVQNTKFIMHGAVKYAQNCAVCHGKIAQGTPNWHEPDANGNYPPPPLDGSGHTWHHSKKVLTMVIKKGGKPMGGQMPAFGSKLSDKDINSIIAWLQTHWPEKILKTWKSNYPEK